jgi:hypothetical protein
MPLGEIFSGLGLLLILESILYGSIYWLGFLLLKIFSMGQLPIAPFSTIQERNEGKMIDWSIWLYSSYRSKALKADCACLVGLLFLIAVGVSLYFAAKLK